MKEQLIDFSTAKLAKEKGFDWGCQDCYDNSGHLYSNGWCERLDDWFEDQDFFNSKIEEKRAFEEYYTRPTQSLLQKWLREVHNILIYVDPKAHHYFEYHIITEDNEIISSFRGNNWEEALEKGLEEALKLIKIKG